MDEPHATIDHATSPLVEPDTIIKLVPKESRKHEEQVLSSTAPVSGHRASAHPADLMLLSWHHSSKEMDRRLHTDFTALEKPIPGLHVEELYIDRLNCKPFKEKEQVQPKSIPVHRALITRNISVACLVFTWGIAIVSISLGTYIFVAGRIPLPSFLRLRIMSFGPLDYRFMPRAKRYLAGHRVYRFPKAVTVLIPLVFNIILTVVLDGINYIHSTTLRWALWHENRLRFNSNLRLFTSAKFHAPNRWYINMFSGLSLVSAYGASSLLTYDIYIKGITNADANAAGEIIGERYGLDFNGWAILGLGISLLVQAMISTWCLCCKPSMVKTWSSNPLNNARACITAGLAQAFPRSNSPHVLVSPPLQQQPSSLLMIPSVKLITRLLWILFGAASLWVIIVMRFSIRLGSTTSQYVIDNSGRMDALAYWQFYGQVDLSYESTSRRDWLGLLIQTAVQACITLGLHCAELLTNVTRDEAIWRTAFSPTGARPDANSLVAAATSWRAIALFTLKPLIHWVFGHAFSANCAAWMNLLPLIALATLMLMLAIFAENLARHKPKGPQPATYGNLQALADLMDDWSPDVIWWGDKGEVDGVRRAGTAGYRLPVIQMDALYTGICPQSDPPQARRRWFMGC